MFSKIGVYRKGASAEQDKKTSAHQSIISRLALTRELTRFQVRLTAAMNNTIKQIA